MKLLSCQFTLEINSSGALQCDTDNKVTPVSEDAINVNSLWPMARIQLLVCIINVADINWL